MFNIPDNLDRFTAQGLRELAAEATTAHAELAASVTNETVTDEQIAELTALKTFVTAVNGKLATEARTAQLADASDIPAVVLATEPVQVNEPAPQADEHDHSAQAAKQGIGALRISDIAPEDVSTDPHSWGQGYGTLVAAADVPGFSTGQHLSMDQFGKAFLARTAGYTAMPALDHEVMHGVAVLQRDYPAELSVWGDERDAQVLAKARDESNLPGGSLLAATKLQYEALGGTDGNPNALLAAMGWCAPSETDYSICTSITTDGLYSAPEVQARRGGVRHNSGLDFSTLFGTGTGYFNYTEAQIIAGVTKPCKEIPCPDFTDDRLGVSGLCLTGNLLAIRGYPEYVSAFTSGAIAALAHYVNALQIAAVASGSTAVTLSGAPWASDGTVVSQVMGAVEMAAVDIKYALRLNRSATLELILPYWLLAQFRADFSRRTGGDHTTDVSLTDSQIMSWFAQRGVRVQWVYDWQDAFADSVTAGEPGSVTPIGSLPTSLKFIIYPAGTWVRAVNDVITLNSVYDSTKLASNQVTHLFTETGWKMLKMCPISRIYTIAICPSGETTSTQSVTC